MAQMNEITQAAYYRGDAALGGGSFGAVKLDTRPLDELAAYTFAYNKQMHIEKQKKLEDQANELADLTAYDLTSAIDKDREHLTNKWNDIYDYVQTNLREGKNVMDFQNNKEGWLEYNRKKADLLNDIKSGKSRSMMYEMRNKEISEEKDPDLKVFYQQMLKKETEDTDIRTPIRYTSQYDLSPTTVNAASRKKVQVTDIGRNLIGTTDYDLIDMDNVANQAVAVISGLQRLNINENSPQFQALPEDEKEIYRQQLKAQTASDKLEPVQSSKNFNETLQSLGEMKNPDGTFKYKDDKGNFDLDKLISSGNPIVAGMAEQVRIYNNKMDEMVRLIDQGAFNDNLGGQLKFGSASGMNKSSYSRINFDDGVSPEELLKMRIVAKSPDTAGTTKIQVTKLGMEQQRLDLDAWYKRQMAEQGRQKTKAYVDNMQAKLRSYKTQQQQDAVLDEIWNRNLVGQKRLYLTTGKGHDEEFKIDYEESLPVYTIQGGKVSQVKPYNATVIYDKYDDKGNPAKNAKVIGYKGGYYKTQYTFMDDAGHSQYLSPETLRKKFVQFYQENKDTYKGDFNDWMKDNLTHDVMQVRIMGENGATDRQMSGAAQRVISNSHQKRGQPSVFDENGDNLPADETQYTESSVDITDQEKTQE